MVLVLLGTVGLFAAKLLWKLAVISWSLLTAVICYTCLGIVLLLILTLI